MRVALVWFRQDLRLADNPAYLKACEEFDAVIPLYILDRVTSPLGEAQAWWLHHSLTALQQSLLTQGLQLVLRVGTPLEILEKLISQYSIRAVFWNRCYEPGLIARDTHIKTTLQQSGVEVHSFNANLWHEPWTIKNQSGGYFKVFTPYWKHCRQRLNDAVPAPMALPKRVQGLVLATDELSAWKLLPKLKWADRFAEYWTPGEAGAKARLQAFILHHLNGYDKNRDFPAKDATSRLSPHLHYGEISPWAIYRAIAPLQWDPATELSSLERFFSELGWREFSVYLLYHFPMLPTKNFRVEYDDFLWENHAESLNYWQKGMTGYPIVDAGLRELWATGYMHNRVRMIAASFLTKDLLIDWRLGAAWFLNTLVDADLANNSASWQWVAGCGADAAPYFRIFNPTLQSEKFDAQGEYIRQWVPEIGHLDAKAIHQPSAYLSDSQLKRINYPLPMIDHQAARHRALEIYRQLPKMKP